MAERTWNIYLSGEIHSDWRDQIMEQSRAKDLPVTFSGPVTDHAASDLCGVKSLWEESQEFWRDHRGRSSLNDRKTSQRLRGL